MLDLSKEFTKEDFLNDVIKTYSNTENRAVCPSELEDDQIRCSYRLDNKKCAIGQYIPDHLYTSDMEGHSVHYESVWNALPFKLKSLGEDFLSDCQRLHDGDEYWNLKCISSIGVRRVERIIEDHKLNKEKVILFPFS